MSEQAETIRKALELATHANHRDWSPIEIENSAVRALPALDSLVEQLEQAHQQLTAGRESEAELRAEWVSMREQLEAAQRKLSCGHDTGTGQNCGECLDCLKVNWHFAQEAVGHLREQLEALREALAKAPFPSGHDPDYAYWFHNGRREALDRSGTG